MEVCANKQPRRGNTPFNRRQLIVAQAKAVTIILVIASLLGISEGVIASRHDLGLIPTDIFATYNFIVLGVGGVFLTRAVLYNLRIVPTFVSGARRLLGGARSGIIRTLANAAIFPIVLDAWSQALQVIYSQPANVPYYNVLTVIFPRPAWESSRYGEWGWFFGRAEGPLNFPYWYYIWIAGIVAFIVIDLVRLFGKEIGSFGVGIVLRNTPKRILNRVADSRLARLYTYFKSYANISFSSLD